MGALKGISRIPESGLGTVTSVGLTLPPSVFVVSGSPVTTAGTLNGTFATQLPNLVWASSSSGATTTPTFRALVTADMPAGIGTVTSISLAAPNIFTVTGSPVTTAGTITQSLATQLPNLVWASSSSGATTTPTFRAIVAADLPATVLFSGTSTTTTVGYLFTSGNLGTISSGTATLAAATANYQYYVNNGAHTLAAPAADSAIDVLTTNAGSAGAITFSGFTVGSNTGDALTTTNTNKFIISVRRINGTSTYTVKALQ